MCLTSINMYIYIYIYVCVCRCADTRSRKSTAIPADAADLLYLENPPRQHIVCAWQTRSSLVCQFWMNILIMALLSSNFQSSSFHSSSFPNFTFQSSSLQSSSFQGSLQLPPKLKQTDSGILCLTNYFKQLLLILLKVVLSRNLPEQEPAWTAVGLSSSRFEQHPGTRVSQ